MRRAKASITAQALAAWPRPCGVMQQPTCTMELLDMLHYSAKKEMLYAVPFQLIKQGLPGDLEATGGLTAIPVGFVKGFQDKKTLGVS